MSLPVHRKGDPALSPLLILLQEDIQTHPEQLQALDGHLESVLEALTADVEVDLDAPLEDQ